MIAEATGTYMTPNRRLFNGTLMDEKTPELTSAARRALTEAEARRAKAKKTPPREVGGRDGPEPTRYGDWEKSGIASDF